MPKQKHKMWCAVVKTEHTLTSSRHDGSFACFLATTREEAISRAMEAKTKWEYNTGPKYYIAVGYLPEKVTTPIAYEVTQLTENDLA